MTQSDLAVRKQVSRLLKELHDFGRPRVWSIIITLFGDAIVPRGGVMALSSIQDIFSHMQIEENAVRTAMSRLTKEGWLEREKKGRQSFYKLAPEGVGQFETATKRIYAADQNVWSGKFDLLITKDEDAKARAKRVAELTALGFGSPVPGVFVRPASGNVPDVKNGVIASLTAESKADKLLEALVAASWPMQELQAGYEGILAKYSPLAECLQKQQEITPLDALALRILLIHDWRRVVLKDVELPDGLKPENWAGEKARLLVGDIYQQLLNSSEKYLDTCSSDVGLTLPKPNSDLVKRFM